jgi:hypothetical protein
MTSILSFYFNIINLLVEHEYFFDFFPFIKINHVKESNSKHIRFSSPSCTMNLETQANSLIKLKLFVFLDKNF